MVSMVLPFCIKINSIEQRKYMTQICYLSYLLRQFTQCWFFKLKRDSEKTNTWPWFKSRGASNFIPGPKKGGRPDDLGANLGYIYIYMEDLVMFPHTPPSQLTAGTPKNWVLGRCFSFSLGLFVSRFQPLVFVFFFRSCEFQSLIHPPFHSANQHCEF